MLRPVPEVDGVLAVDILRDFEYRPTGWAMGRSVGQTALQIFTDAPREALVLPPEIEGRGVRAYFGFLALGNSSDYEVGLVLTREGDDWSLWVDDNNNEDFTDDGPRHANQGTGKVMAATISVEVDIVHLDGEVFRRPYNLWIWFDLTEDGNRVRARFYTRNHYRGSVLVDGRTYAATAYELLSHDALYRDAGLCIDFDGDTECDEDYELFYDGGAVPFPGKTVRLELPAEWTHS